MRAEKASFTIIILRQVYVRASVQVCVWCTNYDNDLFWNAPVKCSAQMIIVNMYSLFMEL